MDGICMTSEKNNISITMITIGLICALIFLINEGVNVDFWKQKLGVASSDQITALIVSKFVFFRYTHFAVWNRKSTHSYSF